MNCKLTIAEPIILKLQFNESTIFSHLFLHDRCSGLASNTMSTVADPGLQGNVTLFSVVSKLIFFVGHSRSGFLPEPS